MNKNLKFIIITSDYNEGFGGNLVMHKLAETLANFGDEVFIACEKKSSEKVKIFDPSIINTKNINDYIIICPENSALLFWHKKNKIEPFNSAKNIIRWILYKVGYFDGFYGSYDIDEKIYTFSKFFTNNTIYQNVPELTYFEPKLDKFYNLNIERNKRDCILIKKGNHKNVNHNGKIIDDEIYEEKTTPLKLKKNILDFDNYLLNLFNEYERFISYDTSTYHSVQAALCGCISIVIPDKGVSKEEWSEKQPLLKYGVAYGFDDIEWAIKTQNLVRPHLEEYYNSCIKTIKKFREDCMKNFTDNSKFSIIIQTRWENLKILRLIDDLENSDFVGEIIIIDNKTIHRPDMKKYEKIRFIIPDKNEYINGSWNLGIENSHYNLISICDDNINFDVDCTLRWIFDNKDGLGCVGLNPRSFYSSGDFNQVSKVKKEDFEQMVLEGWNKLIFIKKENYIKIPEELKIRFGSEWIAKTNKPTYWLWTKEKVTTSPTSGINLTESEEELEKITKRDLDYWKRINQDI